MYKLFNRQLSAFSAYYMKNNFKWITRVRYVGNLLITYNKILSELFTNEMKLTLLYDEIFNTCITDTNLRTVLFKFSLQS